RLMTEQYACVARCDHPRLGDSLSMHEFLAEEYVSVDAPATVHARLDKVLEERGIERKVKIKVSSLLGIGQMITSTNLLAILPVRVARTLERDASIKVLKLPLSLPSYDVCQYWHERYHHEPGHIWFRQTIFDSFLGMRLPAQPAGIEFTCRWGREARQAVSQRPQAIEGRVDTKLVRQGLSVRACRA